MRCKASYSLQSDVFGVIGTSSSRSLSRRAVTLSAGGSLHFPSLTASTNSSGMSSSTSWSGVPYSTHSSVRNSSRFLKCRPIGITAGSSLPRDLAMAPAARTVRIGPVRNRSIDDSLWLVPSGKRTHPNPSDIPVASIKSERPLICVASSSEHPPRRSSALRTTG